MNCRETEDWLLHAERPLRLGTDELREHVEACPGCRGFARRLDRLERAYCAAPLPASAHRARLAFLQRHVAMPRRPFLRRAARWAVAALLLLAVGLGTWAVLAPSKANAGDLVERLVDWNLELTEAPSPEERQRIFAERDGTLRDELKRARLPAEERALAESLLDVASQIAQTEAPLEDAEHFDKIADQLFARIESPAGADRGPQRARMARCYERVLERGVDANLERVRVGKKKMGAPQKGKMDWIMKRDRDRGEKLERMVERDPGAAGPEMRKALDKWHKRPKHKGRGKW